MKTKKSKRVMAVVMAVLLTVGIMPMDWAVTKAAASTVHSFDATAQASVGDDKAVIAEGTTFNDGYFKIVGKVTQRTNSDGSIKAYALFFVDDDLAFFVEHVGYASRCSNASVSFGESASYVCCGTVLVVSQCVNDNRYTARAVSFVC